ncbi:MAG: cysteine hydrolase [Bacteroidia bacterium]|nr:cysteine hydrolase [Bacteroidia bacterium]
MTKKKGLVKKIIFGILGTIILFVLIVFINLIISGQYESVVTKGQPIENYSKRKSALLVIDIQEATTGHLSMYPFFRKNSDELIKNINWIVDCFNDHNILVIHIRSEISNPLINLLNSSYAKGSPGAQFDKRIKTTSGLVVIKRAKDSFKNTNLDSILTGNKVSELYLVGLDAAECINATVEASQNRNYTVNLIEEAILSESTGMKDSMMTVFKNRGVNVLHIDSLNKQN